MKKLIITSILILATSSIIWSQLNLDVKIGISPGSNPVSAGLIVNRDNPMEEFSFHMRHVKPQFYGGIRIHKELRTPFFLEGGLTYTRSTSQYEIDYRMRYEEIIKHEDYMEYSEDILQIPLEIGVSIGNLDVTSGLSLIKTISADNELAHLEGYSADKNSLKWGWQMGVRYGFQRVMAVVEFQSTMQRACKGMYVNEKPLEIMNLPGRFVFSVQYRL